MSAIPPSRAVATSAPAVFADPSVAGGDLWQRPLTPFRLRRPFEAPASRFAAGHRGIDLEAAAGQPIVAVESGTVTFAGTVVDRPVMTLRTSSGELVSLEPIVATGGVGRGSNVQRGAILGTVGSGGHCDAGCVHVGVRVDGDYVNPMLWFGGVPRAILLPWSDG